MTCELQMHKFPTDNPVHPELSVIIPVFNAEAFLEDRLTRLLHLPWLCAAEIICVDDGSTDSSREIMRRLQSEDPRVKLLVQEHGGPGTARNLGIEKAAGEYIAFLDADDAFVSGTALKTAILTAKRRKLDLLLTPSRKIGADGLVQNASDYVNRELMPDKESFSSDELPSTLFQLTHGVVWGKLYRRDLLIQNNIRFPPLQRSEDFPFVRLAMAYSRQIGFCDTPLVAHWANRKESVENKSDATPLIFIDANVFLMNELRKRGLWTRFAETTYVQSALLLYHNLKKHVSDESVRTICNAFSEIDAKFELANCPPCAPLVPKYAEAMALIRNLRQGVDIAFLRQKTIHLAFITDQPFALPTGVAISSIKRHRNPGTICHVHVLCYKVDSDSLQKLRELDGDGFKVELIDVSDKADYSSLQIKGFAVTTTAIFKFRLPEFLPSIDKVLYIDGDVIVRKDLSRFWQTDVSASYVAAVSGRGAFFYKGKTLAERIGYRLPDYFNSGVMLLNLDLMRRDDITRKLFDYRINRHNDFMDQDALNAVLGEKAVFLPFKYNTTSIYLRYSDAWQLNRIYPEAQLKSFDDAFKQSVIYHYSSPVKPWKHLNIRYRDAWESEFAASTFAQTKLERCLYAEESCCRKEERERLIGKNYENAVLSVIIPVRNVQKTIKACLDSVLNQDAVPQVEVICVDDGSTDNTSLKILSRKYVDPRVVLISQEQMGLDAARYHGIRHAHAKCLIFLEADKPLSSPDVLVDAVRRSAVQGDGGLPPCPPAIALAIPERPYRAPESIQLNYFNGWPNFGDAISATLVSRLTGRTVTHGSSDCAELMGMGSLFGTGERFLGPNVNLALEDPLDVWGSGFLMPDFATGNRFPRRQLRVHAVRGKLTADALRNAGLLGDGQQPVFGDPGLLCPDLIPGCRELPKRHDIALIPHRRDQVLGQALADRLRQCGYDVIVIDVVSADPLESIRQIASARKVLSSSLHGLVFADALGIPNRRIIFQDYGTNVQKQYEISNFKFDDYYSAFGRKAPSAAIATDLLSDPRPIIDGLSERDCIPSDEVEVCKQGLLKAFPRMIDPAWKERAPAAAAEAHPPWPAGRKPRILMACEPHRNPFIPVLYNELQEYDVDLDCGIESFWTCPPNMYDIIHFQWADVIDQQTDVEFFSRIEELKNAGCHIIYTRHDACQHKTDTNTSRANVNLERVVDGVFHMGRYSVFDFIGRNPERAVRHYITPHHLYPHISRKCDRTFACRRLGLDPNRPVVLSFGDFRNENERTLVKFAVENCGIAGVQLLAPRLESRTHYVSEVALPHYFAAADVVFIQRLRILNSGNVPMGFYFGKVVVGPNEGDVGECLRETENPVFETAQVDSAATALREGLRLAQDGQLGARNQAYADREWNLRTIAEKTIAAYADLCGCPPIKRTGVADPNKLFDLGDALYLVPALEGARRKIRALQQELRSRDRSAKKLKHEQSEREVLALKGSEAYRVGMFVTWPARRAYRMLKCWRENGLKYTLRRLILGKGRGRK